MNESETNLTNEQKNDHLSMDDILLTKSEDDEDDDLPPNGRSMNELSNSNRQKWRNVAKRVSFQGLFDFINNLFYIYSKLKLIF
jgi:hypothetical protein